MSLSDVTALRRHYESCLSRGPDGEAAAAAVLLGYEPVAGNRQFRRHVTPTGVYWNMVLAEGGWSGEDRFLIATVAGAFTGGRTMSDISRLRRLDDTQLRVWLDIVEAALTGRVPDPCRETATAGWNGLLAAGHQAQARGGER